MRHRKTTIRRRSKFAATPVRRAADLTQRALCPNLDEQAWRIAEIRKAVKEADADDFATDAEVNETLTQWRVNARAS